MKCINPLFGKYWNNCRIKLIPSGMVDLRSIEHKTQKTELGGVVVFIALSPKNFNAPRTTQPLMHFPLRPTERARKMLLKSIDCPIIEASCKAKIQKSIFADFHLGQQKIFAVTQSSRMLKFSEMLLEESQNCYCRPLMSINSCKPTLSMCIPRKRTNLDSVQSVVANLNKGEWWEVIKWQGPS